MRAFHVPLCHRVDAEQLDKDDGHDDATRVKGLYTQFVCVAMIFVYSHHVNVNGFITGEKSSTRTAEVFPQTQFQRACVTACRSTWLRTICMQHVNERDGHLGSGCASNCESRAWRDICTPLSVCALL